MALMDAKEYDPRPAQRRRRLAAIAAVLLLVLLVLWLWPSGRYRYWRQWNIAEKFFAALEHKDFDDAYGLYQGDAGWKQHPEKYSSYTVSQFTLDWGPSGEYGPITSHHVDCAVTPPRKGFGSPSGVIVVITINNRTEPRSMWVENKSMSITDSPYKVLCHGPQ
jgi:hypothetical protein